MQTAIDIPDDIASELYRRAPQPSDRSALVAKLLRDHFVFIDTKESDLEILNRNAKELNMEAVDVLDYQVLP